MSDFKEFFSKNADSYANSDSHKKGEDLNQLVKEIKPSDSDVAIDLASGTGFTAMGMAPYVSRVVAIDGTKEMLEKAKAIANENGIRNIEFAIGDVILLPYEDGTFDIATCRRAAHHFIDKKKFLAETFRVLKKGGRFGLVDMAVPESDQDNVFNQIEIIRDPSHIAAEKVGIWKALMEDAGFKILNVLTSEEEYTVEKWLSPVKMESVEGRELQTYLSRTAEEKLLKGNINRKKGTILKERFVIIAEKP